MNSQSLELIRTGVELIPDFRRVLYRPLIIEPEERIIKILGRIQTLSETEVESEINILLSAFEERHKRLKKFFLQRFEQIKKYLLTDHFLSEERKLLIGAYFTQEYSLESAALFNPSIIWDKDQTNLPPGSRRFIMSLRATGEGHISSITFRSGIVDSKNQITITNPTKYVSISDNISNPIYEKKMFERKLSELNLLTDFSINILYLLNPHFTIEDLKSILDKHIKTNTTENKLIANGILSLAVSNYEIQYDNEQLLSERIIFPHSPSESNGIEDARFVDFIENNGNHIYYATYTAYDGKIIFPQLLENQDFLHFKVSTLYGPEVKNKGMALFPKKINNQYAMLSRQDNENLFLMFSDDLHFWNKKELILKPTYPWEFIQLGNCGSPIELEEGWLVITHGVGPMRKYSIGAFLLEKSNPRIVIGRLSEPLLAPNEKEREGYVPNVVYSCGSIINGGDLILPYAMSDRSISFAKINLKRLLEKLTTNNGKEN